MAKATMKLPDDLIEKISKLGDKTDEICEKALTEGAKVAEKRVRNNLKSVVGKDTYYESRSTGELESSLGVTPVLMDSNGNYNIKIGFDEPRSDDISNAMLANILEYGKAGQAPKPFLKPAKNKAKKECLEKIKSVIESEVDNL